MMTTSRLRAVSADAPRPRSRTPRCVGPAHALEPLDARALFAVTAVFSSAGGTLSVFGDAQDNSILVSRAADGNFLVNGGAVSVQGGPSTVGNTSHIVVNGGAGDDDLSLGATDDMFLTTTMAGGDGDDTLTGSDGIDQVSGDAGSDVALLGDGDDAFVWNAGDGDDAVDGGSRLDEVIVNGNDLAERFDVSDAGAPLHGVRVTRDLGNVRLDLTRIGELTLNTLGGADVVTVNDPTNTELSILQVDLRGTSLTGDDEADSVIVNGTGADDTGDVIAFDGAGGTRIRAVMSPFTGVFLVGAEAANDRLVLNGLGGDDAIDASALPANLIGMTINGGDGNDVLTASQGSDLIDGGALTDTINVAVGNATVLGSGGEDTVNVNADGAGLANVVFDATQRIGALNIGNGGTARLRSGGGDVLTLTSLNLVGTAMLDLADNAMIIDYSGASPVASVQAQLRSGFDGGLWDGRGIVSSAAAADHGTGIGFAEALDLFASFPATFKGQAIDGTSVLLAHALNGDADLSGTVNLSDFNRLAGSFGQSGRRWSQGDFDYDGMVNLSDFNQLAGRFGQSAAATDEQRPASLLA